jgi:peptidoglycan/LPS O-acetylase OafA/YrhL
LYLFIKLFSKTRSKFVVGVIHGALGLAGLGVIIIYISFQKGDTPIISFLFLLMAFFFGAGMVVTTLSEKKFPKVIAVIHAALAITGIYLLVEFWISR